MAIIDTQRPISARMQIALQALALFLVLTTASAKPVVDFSIAKRDITVISTKEGKCGQDKYCHSTDGREIIVKTKNCMRSNSLNKYCSISYVKVGGTCTQVAIGECSYRSSTSHVTLYGHDQRCIDPQVTPGKRCSWNMYLGDI